MDRIELMEAFRDDQFLAWLARELFKHVPATVVENLARQIVLETRLLKSRDIMDVLKEHGLTARLDKGRLFISPAAKVTPELKTVIEIYRPQILDALVPAGRQAEKP